MTAEIDYYEHVDSEGKYVEISFMRAAVLAANGCAIELYKDSKTYKEVFLVPKKFEKALLVKGDVIAKRYVEELPHE